MSEKIDRLSIIALIIAVIAITMAAGMMGHYYRAESDLREEMAELREDVAVKTYALQKLQADLDAHLRDH